MLYPRRYPALHLQASGSDAFRPASLLAGQAAQAPNSSFGNSPGPHALHAVPPAWLVVLPVAQRSQPPACVMPGLVEKKPRAQPSHASSRPTRLEYVPAVHRAQADAPRDAMKVPSPHRRHADPPEAGIKLPAAQARHVARPRSPAKLPGWHGRHAERPVALAEDEPTSHGVHCVAPRSGMDVPVGQDVHALRPRLGANSPGPHRAQAVAPTTDVNSPAAHGVHTPGRIANWPAGHDRHAPVVSFFEKPVLQVHALACVDPTGEFELGVQAVHALAPVVGPYVPAAHTEHAEAPAWLPNRPASHGMQPPGPVAPDKVEYVPAAQASQMPWRREYVPAEQLKQVEAEVGEVRPAAHASHRVRPGRSANVPLWHGKHADAPDLFEYVPALQVAHVVTLRYVPGAHPEHTEAPASDRSPTGQLAHTVAPVRATKVSGGHSLHTLPPVTPRYFPVAHGTHCELAFAVVMVPAGHRLHEVDLTPAANEPGVHKEHLAAPASAVKVPAGHATQSLKIEL